MINYGRPIRCEVTDRWRYNGRFVSSWGAVAHAAASQSKPEGQPMKRIYELERFKAGPDAVIGRLRDPDGNFLCHTLEDEHRRVKVWGETCIPAGLYDLIARRHGGFFNTYSARWPWNSFMIQLANVPNFTDILMHVGNDDDDTAGCVLLGIWRGADNFIGNSRVTYEKAYRAMKRDVEAGVAQLRIIDNDGWIA